MSSKILGLNADTVFAGIIIIMLIILGVITFHYYAYISVGKGSAFNVGLGANVMLLPVKKQEYFAPSSIMPTPVAMRMPSAEARMSTPVMMPSAEAPSVGELENHIMQLEKELADASSPMAFDEKMSKMYPISGRHCRCEGGMHSTPSPSMSTRVA